MDNKEAKQILSEALRKYRSQGYQQLVALIGTVQTSEVVAPSGKKYQIEVEVYWDDERRGNIRVAGGIDDGGFRAFAPLTDDFIMQENGRFIGE